MPKEEWEAPLYQPYKSFPFGRVLLVLVPALLLSVFMYVSESYFGAGIFAVIGIVGIILILRTPKKISCELNNDKVICASRNYPLSLFRGFALRENAIILIPKKKSRKPLRLPTSNDVEQRILDIVSAHLSEVEYEESPGDFVNQFFRL